MALIIVIFVLTREAGRPVRPRRREEGLTCRPFPKKWLLASLLALARVVVPLLQPLLPDVGARDYRLFLVSTDDHRAPSPCSASTC